METVSINQERGLFVLGTAHGYSCMGFDVVFDHAVELVSRIRKFKIKADGALPIIDEREKGTIKQYEQYRQLIALIGTRKIGTWFSRHTPAKVRRILEDYRHSEGTLRLFYGDRKTGRCWMEENDVLGCIGRSTGTLQIPLLIARGEWGGPGVLDDAIVRILDADTREELYRHPSYYLPEMRIVPAAEDLQLEGYTHGVSVANRDGEFLNHGNFRSYGKAAQWVAFMAGECCEQPA